MASNPPPYTDTSSGDLSKAEAAGQGLPPPQVQPGYAGLPPPQPGYAGHPPPQAGYAGHPPPQAGYAAPPPPQQGYSHLPPPQHPGYGYNQPQVIQAPPVAQQQMSNNVVVMNQGGAGNTVILKERGVNHCLHCIISLFFPPWIIVWICLCLCN